MARFSSETIERVRDAVDIAEVLAPYTELKRAGQRLQGLCPFHDERTPSFSVNPQEKLYYCFGCGEKGDVFTFLQEKEGLQFGEAVETLAERFGVEVEREQEDPRLEEARKRRMRLGELLDRTAAYYSKYLWESDEARKAREYLLGRGLSEESLREFEVGFAPNRWDTIVMRGQQGGFAQGELVAAGLVKKGQKGGWMDHFRARIMFPIRDARGRMQGFGGRATRSEQRAKYVNSPDGELFHKSRTLYAIEKARGAIAKKGRAVVVEGYTDVIAAHAAGVDETVAVMGTAITPDQVKLLAAHTGEVVLALDADRAGREAMLRAQGVAAGKKVRLRVAAMPEGEDPADMLGGEGPGSSAAERFVRLVEEAVDLSVFHVGTLLDEADLATPDGRDRALDEVVPVLKGMPDSITRDELVRDVGERLQADPSLVARRLAAAPRAPRPAPRPRVRRPTLTSPARGRSRRSRPGMRARQGRSRRTSCASRRCWRWRSRRRRMGATTWSGFSASIFRRPRWGGCATGLRYTSRSRQRVCPKTTRRWAGSSRVWPRRRRTSRRAPRRWSSRSSSSSRGRWRGASRRPRRSA